ncbi:assimilatory sulfite reductase (NADPH) flavoprotein subunit [Methylocella silvestris]|uniref:Sulfite reductase [NADPH] flavoprotein alpha-component n=1 Tax=Methylocella silvestris TaxID=199596 RepID=A0A2J7THB5_METSI|nr:assimilatory sulfite reductase (NADPH) flavoprotein subunit [Methylocella silvestris]PNG26154.1 assimilatory sulfite reductase (NADPH) flavoprotein subunit [Methylocella silvestris]
MQRVDPSQLPGPALSAEQWRQVNELSATLNARQALWLSGYFAGLEAALAQAGPALAAPPLAVAPAAATARTLTILYGSETGNSAALAKVAAAEAKALGLEASVVDMGDYKPRRLKEEQDVLLIASTYGEGDPPQPAVGFFEFVEGRKAPSLAGLRFGVLALGDSTYEKYCEAGKRLDRRFEELGATRLLPRADCDVDYDEAASAWTKEALALLAADIGGPFAPGAAPLAASPQQAIHDKRNPFLARILDNLVLTGRGSSKETRHIEISLEGSGVTFEPGDALGVMARNNPSVVDRVLEALGLDGAAAVKVKDREARLALALEEHFEITTATPRFLEHWAGLSGADDLERLLGPERAEERAAFLRDHHVIDLIRAFPASEVTPQSFVAGLRPLQPRLYSIASSLAANPDEAHLTVSTVRYMLHGEERCGVASGFFAKLAAPDTRAPVYVQSNPHFRLPADDVPIIMVGAGTGVAPYRAFMQEREARGASGRSWLFFGERNFVSDFLYQAEWQAYLKAKALTRMEVAFSRDRWGKAYVQHRMLEQGRDIFGWLEEGAHFYVCGDAARLAPDVHEALIAIIETHGSRSREAAEDYVRVLQDGRRYQRDVY